MWGWIYRTRNLEPGSLPIQVTDALPQVGLRTLLWGIALALGLAFGLHAGLKLLTEKYAFAASLSHYEFPNQVKEALKRGHWREKILEAPLYAKVPELKVRPAPGEPRYSRAALETNSRVDDAAWLPPLLATYFSSDVSAGQIYLTFVPYCANELKICQEELLKASYNVVIELKHNPLFIVYRLQSGLIQLIATYVFSIGLLVLILRELRAKEIREPLGGADAGKKYAKYYGWDRQITSLSLKETLKTFWDEADLTRDPHKEDVGAQLRDFGAVYYEPVWSTAAGAATHVSRSSRLRLFHTYLANTLTWSAQQRRMTMVERFRTVLPRTILKVTATYAVNWRYSPESACERAGQALDHAVDEIAAAISADRDLYSRLVELTPVVGFFGTVVGLSLAMLGANDVIRAQGHNWNYSILNDDTFITYALQDASEKQQFALQGMLGALSIKFDTTGWALILMFILIVLGARVQRREYRTLSFVHSVVNESLLSVLPTIGGVLWSSTGVVRGPASERSPTSTKLPPAQGGDPAEQALEHPGEAEVGKVAVASGA